MQGSERRPLAIDVHRDHRQIEARCEKTQRHCDAVIEEPLFCVGDVDRVHHLSDDPLGQVSIARSPEPLDPEPTRIFDRAVVEVGHPDGEARHVVHEEVREVLGGNDDHRLRAARLEVGPHAVVRGVEGIADLRISEVLAAADTRGVTAHAGVDEWHYTTSRGRVGSITPLLRPARAIRCGLGFPHSR